MPEKENVGVFSGTPLSNTLVQHNKYLSNNPNPMEKLPEKLETPQIPYFREKPVMLMADGFSLFFKEINQKEYWICEQQKGKSYLIQWIEIQDSKPQKFHRILSNYNGLDVENKTRDTALVRNLHNKTGIEKTRDKRIFRRSRSIYQ